MGLPAHYGTEKRLVLKSLPPEKLPVTRPRSTAPENSSWAKIPKLEFTLVISELTRKDAKFPSECETGKHLPGEIMAPSTGSRIRKIESKYMSYSMSSFDDKV